MLGLDAGGTRIRRRLFTYFILIFHVYKDIVHEPISLVFLVLVMLVLFISIDSEICSYDCDDLKYRVRESRWLDEKFFSYNLP